MSDLWNFRSELRRTLLLRGSLRGSVNKSKRREPGSRRPKALPLLTHHQGVGSHVPEALVLSRNLHCYEGNQVAEQSVNDAKQCPYGRTTKAWNLAVVLPYDLYPEHHLAHGLPQVAFQEDVVKDDDHPVEQTRKSGHRNRRNVPVERPYIRNGRNGSEEHEHHGEQGTEDQSVEDGGHDPPAGDVDVLLDSDERWCNRSLGSHFLTSY